MIETIFSPIAVLGSMGILFGIGLSYAAKIFAVSVDEKVALIRESLPGANCGGCGFPGCDGFAAAVAQGRAPIEACSVGGSEVSAKLGEIMGLSVAQTEKKAARVLCNGNCTAAVGKYDYYGIRDCVAASTIFAGHKSCSHGCLGFGTCLTACPFGAIAIENGVAVVNEALCTACGKCVAACPKKLIELVPVSGKYTVLCRSKDTGMATKKNCTVGCMGCMKCVKVCVPAAIGMEGPLAKINPAKCTNCGECAKVCPAKAIVMID